MAKQQGNKLGNLIEGAWLDIEAEYGIMPTSSTRPAAISQILTDASVQDDEMAAEELRFHIDRSGEVIRQAVRTAIEKAKPKNTKKKRGPYIHTFPRRVALLNFVDTTAPKLGYNLKRIPESGWVKLSEEWNKQNPLNTMSPQVFRVNYQRTKKDRALLENKDYKQF